MFADLDDEQRANLAHEHPTDVHSSPSSQLSTVPPSVESRRSKPASRHRSHTTTNGSSSSYLLARLVSREEEIREINATLAVTSERLEAESSRAGAAERRALDYFHRLRVATESRERAEQESARLREELKLYKMQLDNAQKEIFRAQDIIDQVASQRNEAEADAAKARTKARKLQEEKLVMIAREEGRRVGYKEGLSIGRRIGYDEGRGRRLTGPSKRLPYDPLSLEDYDQDEEIADEERIDPRARIQLRSAASVAYTREHPLRSESAPPVRTFEDPHAPPLPVPSRNNSDRARTPSHGRRTPTPPREPDEPETIHPIPIRPSPTLPPQPINVFPDGWIPRADSRTSYILVPPPHELQQPIPTSPSSVVTEVQDGRPTQQQAPTPVPPPVRARDYAYAQSVPPPIPIQRTSSLASRTSTHISQYDLVNKRPQSSLRHEVYAGRPRSGSQPSRESMSRNEHREQERRYIDRTEAESIAEQWRTDADVPPRNPPRSATPAARSHRPSQFYYRSVTPTPLGDVGADPRGRTPVPTEPIPREQSPPDDPTRQRSRVEHLRQTSARPRPSSGSTIPSIIVESPSEPETAISPATNAAHPELLSPDAANRPLPQDDSHQRQHQHQHQHQSYSQSPQPQHRSSTPAYDVPRSGTPHGWPAGFIPYSSGSGSVSGSAGVQGHGTASRSTPAPASERDRRRGYAAPNSDPDRGYASTPAPVPVPDPYRGHTRTSSLGSHGSHGHGHSHSHTHGHGHPPSGYTRARTMSASVYEAAPLPPGVTYPGPPTRPHTSHRRHRDNERDRDQGNEWDRERNMDWERNWGKDRERRDSLRDRDRDREWDRDRDRDRDRNRDRDWDQDRDRERRHDSVRDYERDRDRDRDRDRGGGGRGRGREHDTSADAEDTGPDEELTWSPAPLQRPISLFDSDEA